MSPGAKNDIDAYAVLGLCSDTSDGEIRRSYKALALRYHPDKACGSEEAQLEAKQRFQEIQAAYEAVSPANRQHYDQAGWRSAKASSKTELMTACETCDIFLAQQLLAKPVDVNETDGTGRTALMLAAATGNTAVVRLLLDHGAQLEAKNCAGHTSLMFAVGAAAKLRPGEEQEKGSKQLAMVQLLLDEGASVDSSTGYGLTSLMLASAAGRVDLIELLLERGADVWAATDIGLTALVMAADKGYAAAVQRLLLAGARPNRSYGTGKTALLGAAALAHTDVVVHLLEGGAEVNRCCDHGNSPLLLAVERKVKDGLACPIQGEQAVKTQAVSTVRVLLAATADPNLAGPGLRTPLHCACMSGDEVLVKMLLDAGANVEARDANGNTPATMAAQKHHEKVLVLLQSHCEKQVQRHRWHGLPECLAWCHEGLTKHFSCFLT